MHLPKILPRFFWAKFSQIKVFYLNFFHCFYIPFNFTLQWNQAHDSIPFKYNSPWNVSHAMRQLYLMLESKNVVQGTYNGIQQIFLLDPNWVLPI